LEERKPSIGSEGEGSAALKPTDSREHGEWILPQPKGPDASFEMIDESVEREAVETTAEDSTPVRRIALFSRSAVARKPKRHVVVQSTKDLNPLKPCGACNEWLKKIAESNPYFQILTFTDADCHGVYCTPCQE